MVTKSKKTGAKKGRVKVGKLKLNKETVKDLAGSQQKQIKGGEVKSGLWGCPSNHCGTVTKEGAPGCY